MLSAYTIDQGRWGGGRGAHIVGDLQDVAVTHTDGGVGGFHRQLVQAHGVAHIQTVKLPQNLGWMLVHTDVLHQEL